MEDHDTLIRIEAKVDMLLDWVKMHDTTHMRARLAVGTALLAALISCVITIASG